MLFIIITSVLHGLIEWKKLRSAKVSFDLGHCVISPNVSLGPKTSGESVEASECHPGGEGEREPAEPAAGGLQ